MDTKKTSDQSRLARRKENTTQRIVTTSMQLFVSQGIDSTSMEQIAEEVDIAKGTLYNYFPAKEAIIDEYIRRTFAEQHSERMDHLRQLPDTRTRMAEVLRELMEGVRAQEEIFEQYFIYRIQKMISLHPSESKQSGLYLLEAEIIRLGQDDGEIRRDLPPDLLTGLFEFVFVKVAQLYYKQPDEFETSRVIEHGVELFMNGVGL